MTTLAPDPPAQRAAVGSSMKTTVCRRHSTRCPALAVCSAPAECSPMLRSTRPYLRRRPLSSSEGRYPEVGDGDVGSSDLNERRAMLLVLAATQHFAMVGAAAARFVRPIGDGILLNAVVGVSAMRLVRQGPPSQERQATIALQAARASNFASYMDGLVRGVCISRRNRLIAAT